MKDIASPLRRILTAVIALVLCPLLFRAPIADALVLRGDELLYGSRQEDALTHYRRALAIDPDSETAADRYVFVSLLQHTPAALERAARTADRYLRTHPSDGTLLADRALCELRARRYRLARRDFERAGRVTRDLRYTLFARRIGERRRGS